MDKTIINTPHAPAPIGPYSQAVKAGGFYFISGQIAMRADSAEMVVGSIDEETEQVMQNLKSILESGEMDFSNVVKSTIFLTDMQLFTRVNEIYGKYFTGHYPARETVAVKGLPKNVNVEISMIACK